MNLPLTDNFKTLLLSNTPLIDVRAPVEFEKGAFPSSVNLPLMTDKEREAVGICYKEEGNRKALELGHRLVKGDIKEARVKAWCDFISKHPDAVLYCFRGGDRSRISQEWLYEAGCEISRIKGGYKAFRRYILNEFETMGEKFKPLVLGGYTGSGKTILLQRIRQSVDLEALAHHRGSAFGHQIDAQPTQIDFEHELAASLLRQIESGTNEIVVEDESRRIGRREIPQALFSHFKASPLVILDIPMEKRIETIFQEYVNRFQKQFAKRFGEDEGMEVWKRTMLRNFGAIQRKLGGERHAEMVTAFEEASKKQMEAGSVKEHAVWIEALLRDYYDPMYGYQMEQNKERILFRGDEAEVLAFFKERKIK
ncbi:Selenophosphate-dependent tRNA 2-selenouridine synthase [hydrothermal vent metagenome]|uniref:Selenophosphate-dependent tRNA 2-selenouridine synthase n=1 Tax=hydrothermal vent metagenome TaxID=652676 RepID=A0A1W1CV39_9ZZZZ